MAKKKPMAKELNMSVILYPGEDGYVVAECTDIPGCISQGKTQEEALKNIADAAQACLAVMLEDCIKYQSKSGGSRHRTSGTPKTLRVTGPQAIAV